MLDEKRIVFMTAGLGAIAVPLDPVGSVLCIRPNESNQTHQCANCVIASSTNHVLNVTADAAGLCFKSGNAVILRGGSESFHSSTAILNALV